VTHLIQRANLKKGSVFEELFFKNIAFLSDKPISGQTLAKATARDQSQDAITAKYAWLSW
jgi:hypothetical protein